MIRPILLFLLLVGCYGLQAQDQVFTGKLNSEIRYEEYTVPLDAGQVMAAWVETTGGDLIPFLILFDPVGERLVSSFNADSPDSVLAYRATKTGTYSLAVTNAGPESSSGVYRLRVEVGDEALLDDVAAVARIELSGPGLIQDTPHFRIHYTLRGADTTSEDYIGQVATALEAAWTIQIGEMGWPAPPPDLLGGDSRYDVYIANLKNRDGLLLGYVDRERIVGDNPNSAATEAWAADSFLVLENDFAEVHEVNEGPLDLMRATVAHEFNHAVQMGYDANDALDWYYEATAVWMEIATFDLGFSAIEYIDDNLTYPEVCFGSLLEGEGGVGLEYGDWLFIQSLVDRYGEAVVQQLWQHIADDEGFTALEQTLAAYGDTVPDALARHHIQVLTRDYPFSEQSSAVLWLANTIRDVGHWTPDDPGVQELGANFYYLKRPPGRYDIRLDSADKSLELWSIGVHDGEAQAARLGRGGTVTTEGYQYVYLMVFNRAYDDDVSDCQYATYSLNVSKGTGQPVAPTLTLDATHFLPLQVR